jgi:hypothetical protein
MEMPAWVVSISLASDAVKQGVDAAVYVCDADANIKRLPVSLTLEAVTCTVKCASASVGVVCRTMAPWHRMLK